MNVAGARKFEEAAVPRLRNLLSRTGIPGLALAVDSPRIRAAVGVGLASSRSTSELTPGHRLPISCVMKVLVALLILHGDGLGLLNLDEDIATYLPELAGEGEARTGIRVRHLLTHTAGYVEPQENAARWGYTWERFSAFFPRRTQAFAPGAVWSYTHTGYAILHKIVEAAYDRAMPELLEEFIFAPMAIHATLYGGGQPQANGLMSLHVRSPRTSSFEPMRPPVETGFLRYSISDFALSAADIAMIARFLAGGLAGKVPHLEQARIRIAEHSIALPHFCSGPEGEVMPVAFCHGVSSYGVTKGVNGSYVGSTCAMRFDEQAKIGIAATLNTWAPHARDVAVGLASRILRGPPKEAPGATHPLPDLGAIEGDYQALMLGADVASIRREQDTLVCRIRRRGLPELVARIGSTPTGLAPIAGAKDIAIAFATNPESGEPYVMVGTSACHRIH